MSCCGKKRAALTAQYQSWNRQPAPALVSPAPVADPAYPLRYVGSAPLSLRGPRSGRVYAVGEQGAAIAADPRDVDALLATRLFDRQ